MVHYFTAVRLSTGDFSSFPRRQQCFRPNHFIGLLHSTPFIQVLLQLLDHLNLHDMLDTTQAPATERDSGPA